jgi:hypothetical protein
LETDSLYFEIAGNGNSIRVEIVRSRDPGAIADDRYWLDAAISVKGGVFSGKFNACLVTTDFEPFKRELEALYQSLKGQAKFNTPESQVEITIDGDGMGKLNAQCSVMDHAGIGNTLEFEIDMDQTYVPGIIRQLDTIISTFKTRQ